MSHDQTHAGKCTLTVCTICKLINAICPFRPWTDGCYDITLVAAAGFGI